jgi:hypothetical protein
VSRGDTGDNFWLGEEEVEEAHSHFHCIGFGIEESEKAMQ